jgi:hypothetical protein
MSNKDKKYVIPFLKRTWKIIASVVAVISAILAIIVNSSKIIESRKSQPDIKIENAKTEQSHKDNGTEIEIKSPNKGKEIELKPLDDGRGIELKPREGTIAGTVTESDKEGEKRYEATGVSGYNQDKEWARKEARDKAYSQLLYSLNVSVTDYKIDCDTVYLVKGEGYQAKFKIYKIIK